MPVRISLTTKSVASLLVSTSNLCLSYILPDQPRPPISRIPVEVLQEIFLFTLLSPHDPSDNDPIKSPETYTPVISESCFATPFPLSHVNGQWRAIVNNTPALWRSITVVAPHRNLLYRAELWLERSGNYSLDIVIRQYHMGKEISDATDKLLGMLAVHSARWRSVIFLFHLGIPSAAVNALADLQRLPKPCLQDAGIWSGEDNDSVDGPPGANGNAIYQALQGIPSLRKFVWESSYITPQGHFGAQLQFLEIMSHTCIKELADTISHCPNLRYLSAQHLSASTVPGVAPAGDVSFIPFLDRFTVPSLLQLQLKNITDHADIADDDALPRPTTRTAVQALLQRSHCCLIAFYVHILHASAAEARAWLTMPEIDDVRMLSVSGAAIDNAVLALLTRGHGQGDASARARFPRLEDLWLSLCDASVDEEVLLRMLRSRFWTPGSVDAVDDPVKTRQELLTADVWVRERTPNMAKCEELFNMYAEGEWEWKGEGRKLRFTVWEI